MPHVSDPLLWYSKLSTLFVLIVLKMHLEPDFCDKIYSLSAFS